MNRGDWILLRPTRRHPRGDLALVVGLDGRRIVVRRWRETKCRLSGRDIVDASESAGSARGSPRLAAALEVLHGEAHAARPA